MYTPQNAITKYFQEAQTNLLDHQDNSEKQHYYNKAYQLGRNANTFHHFDYKKLLSVNYENFRNSIFDKTQFPAVPHNTQNSDIGKSTMGLLVVTGNTTNNNLSKISYFV